METLKIVVAQTPLMCMRKTILSLWLVIPLAWLFSSCGTATQPDATQFPESMKGYELYSWQEGKQWKFSLLVGTNREKTLDEIKSIDTVLPDVEALLSTLQKIPSGQSVTWSSKETLSFPPDNIIKQVKQISKDKGLILNIVK
jgi:hypothetical protein